jgi:hypothetical protein
MTGSVEGHKRYWKRRELSALVGKNVEVIHTARREVDSGTLCRTIELDSIRDSGFYLNGKRIPVRSVKEIIHSYPALIVDDNYLKNYRGKSKWD